MAAVRNPNREKAQAMWRESSGSMLLKEIAAALGEPESKIRKWKCQDNWDGKSKSNAPAKKKGNAPLKKKRSAPLADKPKGAPIGNKNAAGNHGNKNASAPRGNQNAATHGLYSQVIPEEDLDLFHAAGTIKSLEYELQLARYKVNRLIREQQNREMMGVMGGPEGVENYRLKDDFYEQAIQKGLDIVRKLEAQMQKQRFDEARLEIEQQKLELMKLKLEDDDKDEEIIIKPPPKPGEI